MSCSRLLCALTKFGLCLKSPGSLCNLRVLCVSVVCFCSEFINHRDTENTEVAQRRAFFGLLGQSFGDALCLKSLRICLDRVSTTCGSGGVMDQVHKTFANRAPLRRTHPLPQVLLPRSKRDV